MHHTTNISSDEIDRISPLEDDLVAFRFINDKTRAFDLGLFATKWFDYRHLTPLQATRLYVSEYGPIWRRVFGRERDRRVAEEMNTPFDIEKILARLPEDKQKDKRLFMGFWRGRQIADALGMPYDLYIDLAFTYRMRHWKQGYLPQPYHLYHEYDVEKIQNRWEELQASRLYLSDHHAYLVQNYTDLPHQNDYHEWLFKQAGLRANSPAFLARFVNDDALPIEKVRARLDEFQLSRFNDFLEDPIA